MNFNFYKIIYIMIFVICIMIVYVLGRKKEINLGSILNYVINFC